MTVLKGSNTHIWRILIIAVVGMIVSVGGWVFSEVRDMPVVYETIKSHNADIVDLHEDIAKWDSKLQTQQSRIEDKIDETNTFLRDYFANKPPTQ